jgi:hypothetical protein
MKIAVCVKQVPDSWAEKKMVNGLLDRENVDAVLNMQSKKRYVLQKLMAAMKKVRPIQSL